MFALIAKEDEIQDQDKCNKNIIINDIYMLHRRQKLTVETFILIS